MAHSTNTVALEATTQQLPVLFQDSRYGSLVTLPKILKQNQDDLDLLEIEYSALTKQIDELKLPTADLKTLEDLNVQSLNARKAIGDKYKAMNERRKPFTAWMAEVTSEYTAVENKAVALADKLKGFNNRAEAEKSRRNELAKTAAAAKLAEETKGIETSAAETVNDWKVYLTYRTETAKKFVEVYNSKQGDELKSYRGKLLEWSPSLKMPNSTIEMKTDYFDYMNTLCDNLLNGKPFAIEDPMVTLAMVSAGVAAAAEQQVLEAAASVAVPVVAAARGTSKKLVYQPSTVQHIQKLALWFVETQLVGMDIATAEKKFGFMLVQANKSLNAGVVVSGVPTGEDFNTKAI